MIIFGVVVVLLNLGGLRVHYGEWVEIVARGFCGVPTTFLRSSSLPIGRFAHSMSVQKIICKLLLLLWFRFYSVQEKPT